MRIHWCGTGLSSRPGLRRLLEAGHPMSVWNLPVEAAYEAVGDITDDIHTMDPGMLEAALQPGDIVISMLPAAMHDALAAHCVDAGVNFISSSYLSPAMRDLDGAARDKGVVVLGEVGLDPGIDHLMAHDLVAAYRASSAYDAANVISFTSYCGGVPKQANAFRYKFSWSPLGVLKALLAPARSIRDYVELEVAHPWDAVTDYTAPLPHPEKFEVYPNRDSLPFIADYRFDPAWKIRNFTRGTLRLNGWTDAWADISAKLDIPVIGIGAGAGTDGQVLVMHDLLGLSEHTARFVQNFMAGQNTVQGGLKAFVDAEKAGEYPREEHSYQ